MNPRRGFALLIVLAATVVVSAGIISTIALLTQGRQTLTATSTDDRLHDLLLGGEHLALAWITANASQVVLSDEATMIPTAHESWQTQDDSGEMTVDLYDGCGMIPARCAGGDGGLHDALPGDWATVSTPPPTPTGEEPADWLELAWIPDGKTRFPGAVPRTTQAVAWSTIGTIARPPTTLQERPRDGLASLVCPHSGGAININTAPAGLLRAAFAKAGTSGVEEVLRNRRRSLFTAQAPEVQQAAGYHFVTTSQVWCAHIQVRWNETRRSWWVVVAGNPAERKIVQRHDADR
jgi:hypothetical protein